MLYSVRISTFVCTCMHTDNEEVRINSGHFILVMQLFSDLSDVYLQKHY